MRISLHDLKLDHLYLITPGTETYPLDEKITVIGLEELNKSSIVL